MESSAFVNGYGDAAAGDVAVLSPRITTIHSQASLARLLGSPLSSQQARMPIHLSTYTPGEDFGRLATLAKEFGLERIRNQRNQIRKSIPALQVVSDSHREPNKRRPALQYIFSGYSIWLELEQKVDINGLGDLDVAVALASDEFDLGGVIPSPHVTALYGITTIATDEEARSIFRGEVMKTLSKRAEKRRKDGSSRKVWPDLEATGILVGAEFDGVDGGLMDMAWAEISFASSAEHEAIIDDLYKIFHSSEECQPRSHPWVPHLSICYDNPDGYGCVLTQQSFIDFLRRKCPTLAVAADANESIVKFTRAVSGISLWKTAGVMADWKCLDRLEFNSLETAW